MFINISLKNIYDLFVVTTSKIKYEYVKIINSFYNGIVVDYVAKFHLSYP